MANIQTTPNGQAYLHIWRSGTAYESVNKLAHYKEWTNVRFAIVPRPNTKHILVRDIRKGLPYPNQGFDVVYCNHVMEHLTPDEGIAFLKELKRVLKSTGRLRLVVPDLERAARDYLRRLDEYSENPTKENYTRYNWSVLNLIDQMVREKSGGKMIDALNAGHIDDEHVLKENGDVFNQFLTTKTFEKRNKPNFERPSALSSLFYKALRFIFYGSKRKSPHVTGEINKWLYDRISLPESMKKAGFNKIERVTYKTSKIENWEKYNFDKSNYGDYPIEPSIYFEAVR